MPRADAKPTDRLAIYTRQISRRGSSRDFQFAQRRSAKPAGLHSHSSTRLAVARNRYDDERVSRRPISSDPAAAKPCHR